jgi:ferredoxin
MPRFRIQIDQSLCSGFGSCVDSVPEAVRLDGPVASVHAETDSTGALDAAADCPMGAIAVFDADTGEQVA